MLFINLFKIKLFSFFSFTFVLMIIVLFFSHLYQQVSPHHTYTFLFKITHLFYKEGKSVFFLEIHLH